MTRKEMLEVFKREVADRAAEVDPKKEHDWYSVTVGWAMGKGLSPVEANAFARYIRYD